MTYSVMSGPTDDLVLDLIYPSVLESFFIDAYRSNQQTTIPPHTFLPINQLVKFCLLRKAREQHLSLLPDVLVWVRKTPAQRGLAIAHSSFVRSSAES